MTTQNRNSFAPQALPFSAPEDRLELRHPFFDSTDAPTRLDCLDAINRAACVIELFHYLELDGRTQGELSPRAVSGYRYLTEMLHETLTYSTRQLAILGRKRRKKAHERARYLSALSSSLVALDGADRDHLLNATASRLQLTRADVDKFIEKFSPKT